MKPYYDSDGITIYHADCMDVLPSLSPVDLVLTDPPYNVGVEYGQLVDDNKEDFRAWIEPIFKECRRLARTVLITGQAQLPTYALIEPWKWLLAWHKPAAMGRSPVGFCNWEPVAMWGDGSRAGADYVKAPIIPDPNVEGHPCPKPLGWATGLLGLFPKASSVLDPFMGSGTTLVAAKQAGRTAIGIEIEEQYCEMAVTRLAQGVLSL